MSTPDPYMTFVDALLALAHIEDANICADEDERWGLASICVHDDSTGAFVGKLRWPQNGETARVDHEVAEFVRRHRADLRV